MPQTTGATLRSSIDDSVNFVTSGPDGQPGFAECRYVRRDDSEVLVYVSSQLGCRQACRFCHLTQTGQTSDGDLTPEQILDQFDRVIAHYDQVTAEGLRPSASKLHLNFMARGEPLANRLLIGRFDDLAWPVMRHCRERGLLPALKISTIMPRASADLDLVEIFGGAPVDLYYSLYSLDPSFRRRWLPKAMDPLEALERLVQWQRATRRIPVLHWAMIAGENDSEQNVREIAAAVQKADLRCDFNFVRYNPASPKLGAEPSEEVVAARAELLRTLMPHSRLRVVPRVGFDVQASCGMFVAPGRGEPLPLAA